MLVPGVVTTSNDIVTGTATTSFPVHGGRTNEGRLTLDGLNIGSPPSGNSATSYVVDIGDVGGGDVSDGDGARRNGNGRARHEHRPAERRQHHARLGLRQRHRRALQSDNLTPALRAQGVTAATPLTGVYDVTATLGGPIAQRSPVVFRERATPEAARRRARTSSTTSTPATSSRGCMRLISNRPEYSDRTFENASARVTWQITPRHKISGFWDTQQLCRACTGATPGLAEPQRVSPEAVGVLGRPLNVAQATWSSPLTNRLLVDAGFGATFFGVGNFEREPNPTRGLIRVAEQCASGCAANGNIPGLVYRSQDFSVADTGSYLWRAALTYVTGAHSLKVGYQHTFMTDDRTWMTNDQNLTYRFNNGVPNQLTQSISPWVNNARVAWQGLYVQDQWTRDRLTLQGAARFDRAWSWFPSAAGGTVAVSSDADRHPRNTRRRQLQGRDAADGRGVRRDRDRQDGAEDDPRQVPRGRRRVRHVCQHQSHAAHAADDVGVRHRRGDTRLDRRQSEFRARLRSDERRGAGSSRRGRRSVRRRLEHELRQERADEQFRSGIARRLGRPAVRLASRRLARAADRLAIVGRRHLHPSLVSTGSRSSTTVRCSRPI